MVFVDNCTVSDCFGATITHIRCLIKAAASFLFESGTGLIAGWTGGTLYVTKYNLVTYILFLTMIPMNKKVVSIVKGALMISTT